MKRFLALVLLLLALVPVPSAFAVNPDEVLDDPVLEARAREISKELRCLVCQNQDIDDSNADLARDLRVLVRERLVAGDSDQEVLDYLVARYGEFVLLRPVMAPHTLLLWIAAPLVLLTGIGAIVIAQRRRAAAEPPTALSAEEKAVLAKLEHSDDSRA